LKKIGLVLVLLFCLINYQSLTTVNSFLSEGDSLIYDIVDAGYYLEIETEKVSFNGYKAGMYEFPTGSKVNVTVEEVQPNGTLYNFQIENISRYGFLTLNWFDIFCHSAKLFLQAIFGH